MDTIRPNRFAKGLRLFVIAALLAVVLGVLPMPVTHAVTITVDTTADELDGGADNGGCSLYLPGTITIRKDADPADGTNFTFSGGQVGGPPQETWTLDDAVPDDGDAFTDSRTWTDLQPGTYFATETPIPAGWDLSSIVCVDPDGGTTTNLGTATATIDLDADETVTCTFTNVPQVPVGGIVVPVNKLGLLAPWMGLAALAALGFALVRKRRSA
jgi:hypothetical protein